MRKYTDLPSTAFSEMLRNAGILLKGSDAFSPTTGEYSQSDILGATSGGINFADKITYSDFADDIDNAPKNLKEFKVIESREVTASGTMVTLNPEIAKMLMAAADIDTNDGNHISPRDVLKDEDFNDIWFITDYGDVDGGFVALHLMNCLSTDGFNIQSTDKKKGTFSFGITAHYSSEDVNLVPYEIFIYDSPNVTYAEADISNGFEIGKTYYIEQDGAYERVTSGTPASEITYYTRQSV